MHLPSIKTVVYTIKKNRERQHLVTSMMNELGFKNWGFWFGSERDDCLYWQNMHNDFRAILDTPTPFILMEDDATLTEGYASNLDIPTDAQAVYLGGSSNGEWPQLAYLRQTVPNLLTSRGPITWSSPMLYTEYSEQYIRIYNMHSHHALLFLDDSYCQAYRKYIDENRDIPTDIVFGRYMHRYTVYCLKQPMWYQKDNHHEAQTLLYYPQE